MNLYKFFSISDKTLSKDGNVSDLEVLRKLIIVDEYERDEYPKPDEMEKYN
tara:strand:- start:118 stop:270 length:153 start_codon:yes stop_codon:yes gene_type:complete